MDAAIWLGASAIALAIIVPLAIEWLKHPRLEIRRMAWRASAPVDWTFAAVRVYNRPLGRPWRWFLVRQSAEGCEVTLEFRRLGEKSLAIPAVGARWSSRPEPLRSQPISRSVSVRGAGSTGSSVARLQGPTLVTFVPQFDLALVPDTRRMDVAPNEHGEEIAVAILRDDGKAYAWGAESYAYPGWENPEWSLPRGEYEVLVRVEAAGIGVTQRFKLDNTTSDFARFDLAEPTG
jgi:hypothetical protein